MINKRKMMYYSLPFLGLVIMMIAACNSSKKEMAENVIISVGEGNLTLEQLDDAIPESIQSKISQEQVSNYIQQWIEMELVYQEALRLGMDKEKSLLTELENAKRELLVRSYLDRHLSDEIEIPEREARAYYNENKDNYILQQDEIKALHILVSDYDQASAAYRRIQGGEDFEAVAREISIDYTENGRIDLGYFSREEIVPEIASGVFSTRVGRTTRPLRSEFGYHIFKILDRKANGNYREFEEVEDQVIARLKSIKRNEKYIDLIIDLRSRTDINRNDNLLREIYNDSTYQHQNQVTTHSE
jgi:peptidyl-prolyl cis-trans isomerase C